MCLTQKIPTHVRYNNAQVYALIASCFVLNCVSIVDSFAIFLIILSYKVFAFGIYLIIAFYSVRLFVIKFCKSKRCGPVG